VQFKNFENFHLVEVPLKGQTTVELKNGSASFGAVKFDTTSYNNEVTYFLRSYKRIRAKSSTLFSVSVSKKKCKECRRFCSPESPLLFSSIAEKLPGKTKKWWVVFIFYSFVLS
jgi:hypothetical protein